MKIRTGFVSNSSSSSFVLNLKNHLVKELLAKVDPKFNSFYYIGPGRYSVIMDRHETEQLITDEFCSHREIVREEIANLIKELGNNFVYVRESDEGIEGYLFEHLGPDKERELTQRLGHLAQLIDDYH